MTNHPKPLGVGVVGLGIGEQHAKAFASSDNCELRWLFDILREQAEIIQGRIGAGEIAGSYDEILADDKVDIVAIATLDHMHFEGVQAALEAGKHVFVEKPLCRTEEELQTLKQAWTASGRPHLQSNLVLRQAPVYDWLKSVINEGRLGKIFAFDGDYLYGRLEKIIDGWRGNAPDYSVMEGGGIHMIDLMLWLTGEQPAMASTVGNDIATRGTDFGYNDFMATTFLFPSGLIGRITANFACVHPHHHVVRVFGTEATFIYDDQGPRLHTSRRETAKAEPVDAAPLPVDKGVLIPGFVQSIISGCDPTPAAGREFELIRICATADRSLNSQKVEEILYR